jgi:transposase
MNAIGTITMTMREVDRFKVIQAVTEARLKPGQAAERLGLRVRQVERLVQRYEAAGVAGLVSGKRGRPGNHQLSAVVITADELPALDAELTERVARGFADSTAIIAEHFRGCGFAFARASSTAAALVAALEGARTIARLERTPAVFDALAEVSVQGWALSSE